MVLKGAYTVVATEGAAAAVNPYANPALATAGTGDVLSGVIGALLAKRLPAGRTPAAAAVCAHLRAGAPRGWRRTVRRA